MATGGAWAAPDGVTIAMRGVSFIRPVRRGPDDVAGGGARCDEADHVGRWINGMRSPVKSWIRVTGSYTS